MNSQVNLSLVGRLDISKFHNKNLSAEFMRKCMSLALEGLERKYRKYTGEESKKHILEVAKFGEGIARSGLEQYIFYQFLLHDYDEEIEKAMKKKGKDNYIPYSPLYSEFQDEVSFFTAQVVRLMNKKTMENHLIYLGVLDKSFSSMNLEEKEERYRKVVLAMRGYYGLPVVLKRLPSIEAPLIMTMNKCADLISNAGFYDKLNVNYLKNRFKSQSLEESAEDIRGFKESGLELTGLEMYLDLLQNQYRKDFIRLRERVVYLVPKLFEFASNHSSFSDFFDYDRSRRFIEKSCKRAEKEILEKKLVI